MNDFGWKQVPTPSGVQESMLVIDRHQHEVRPRRRRYLPTRPIAHPELPYRESRKLRDDTHPVFRWLRGVPLDVIDDKLGDIVMELADEDVKRTANALSKGVKKLGYKGSLELVARIGYLLSQLEKGE